MAEHIGHGGDTRGTETSKYPQEKKTTVIPQVVASERGRAQTGAWGGGKRKGLPAPSVPGLRTGMNEARLSGSGWNAAPKGVKAPYAKGRTEGPVSRVPRGTWNPVGSREDHLPRLNTSWRPIAEQYREGKVKRTPGGE